MRKNNLLVKKYDIEEKTAEKTKKENFDEMKTIVLIPTEPAPEDPQWLLKKHANKKLDPIEIEEYYKYLQENDLK